MANTHVTVRVATLGDDRALAELDAISWPFELRIVPPQPASEPFFGPRRRPQDVLVAIREGAVIGYARLDRHMGTPTNDHVLHFAALAVSPHARGAGVGAMLVRAGIDEARRRGARKFGLRALSTNLRAIRLYTRHGFREEGRLIREFRLADGTYADDLWFALWLDPPVRE
jgi:ribosomal protein S18 acetylase RimI-like enzyme